jgi:Cdc6-like AAA superfamily ATPase
VAIIKQRLEMINEQLFEENALILLSKKIASSGDIRKALDVCE